MIVSKLNFLWKPKWPDNMSGHPRICSDNARFWPDIVRRPTVISSPVMLTLIYVISMEFLSPSRWRSSLRNVLQRRWARRNVCHSQAKMTFKEQLQKFHTDDVPLHIPGGCFWLVEANVPIRKPMTGTTQISLMIHHQCGISALVPQTSFHEETSGGIANAGCVWGL